MKTCEYENHENGRILAELMEWLQISRDIRAEQMEHTINQRFDYIWRGEVAAFDLTMEVIKSLQRCQTPTEMKKVVKSKMRKDAR